MRSCCYFCLAIYLSASLASSRLAAYTTTIALSGGEAEDTGGGVFESFSTPALNNLGTLLVSAQLEQDGAIITSENDAGIWRYRSGGGQIGLPDRIAQTGVDDISGVSETSFESLGQAALDERNEVFYGARLVTGSGGVTSDNARGIWFHSSALNRLPLVRTGSANVADVFGAHFIGFPSAAGEAQFNLAVDGSVALVGTLETGVGGVTTATDRGIWRYTPTSGQLIARESIANAPEAFAPFNTFGAFTANGNDQSAFFATLKIGGAVTTATSRGIWRFDGTSGTLLAQSQSGGVPGLPGRDFVEFPRPLINEAGNVLLFSQLDGGTKGIWQFTSDETSLLALTDAGNVPEVADSSFANLTVWAWNDGNQALVDGVLVEGTGGVDGSNDSGLWLLGENEQLVARVGSGGVAGVSGASFSDIGKATLNNAGQVGFFAVLAQGEGGVDASNDTGLWLSTPNGEGWLVAREGQTLAGKTIASLDFLDEESAGTTGINDLGELAFVASFTDGNSGVFLFRPYAADFDRSGGVDALDLSAWQSAYGSSAAADADNDGDSDGADFLVWQREVGSGTSPAPMSTAVPEPASVLLTTLGLGCSLVLARPVRRAA